MALPLLPFSGMKPAVILLIILTSAVVSAQGFSPSRDAATACRDVQPAGAWKLCVESYQSREQALKQDPAYQAELRRQKMEAEAEKRRAAAATQQAEIQRRYLEALYEAEQARRMNPPNTRPPINCDTYRYGNNYSTQCR